MSNTTFRQAIAFIKFNTRLDSRNYASVWEMNQDRYKKDGQRKAAALAIESLNIPLDSSMKHGTSTNKRFVVDDDGVNYAEERRAAIELYEAFHSYLEANYGQGQFNHT